MIDDKEAEGRRIGERVRLHREMLGLESRDVARSVGMTPEDWAAAERTGGFTAIQLRAAARIFDIPPRALFDVDGSDARLEDGHAAMSAMRRIDDPRLRAVGRRMLDLLADVR